MKIGYKKITPDIIDKLIGDYYANECQEMDRLVKNFVETIRPQIEVDKIIGRQLTERQSIKIDLNEYEDQIVKMLDLATILSDRNCDCDESMRAAITDYLIEKNKTILPDIIEIIQLAKKWSIDRVDSSLPK